jgi:drug/metabolite transporter (DMT)-like permease
MLLCGSSLLFAATGAAVKLASPSVSNEMAVFFRSFFGLIVLIPWLVRGGLGGLRTAYPRQQVTRALAGLAAMYCFFYAIAHLPLAEAMLLN